MSKFNKSIVSAIKSDEVSKKQQEKLKSRYHIPEEDERIIVEKNNMIKFTVNTAGTVFRVLVNIIIFFFAVAGAAAIIFPESRNELLYQAKATLEELKSFLPVF